MDPAAVLTDPVPVATNVSIRVAIVEDTADVRDGLSWLFSHSPGFHCCGAFGSAEEALGKFGSLTPDVALLDIGLPGKSGIECLPLLKKASPGCQFAMLTVFDDEEVIFQALQQGATGYLLKKTPPGAILDAVKDLHAGGSPISSQIARKVLNVFIGRDGAAAKQRSPGPAGQPLGEPDGLCAREQQILELLAKGYRYKEIADQLGITIHTVRTFIRRMYEKLQVHSRMEAVLKARI